MNSEATIAESKLNIENLTFQFGKVRLELTSKEEEARNLVDIKENLEREKMNIQLSADNLSDKLISSDQEVKKLDGFIHSLIS
uniref:Synaptonemal complex protein 1 n=1 Tax=Noccaea caerulescens TaxID=107243 RepID=A0A1J3FJA5_NOCCA